MSIEKKLMDLTAATNDVAQTMDLIKERVAQQVWLLSEISANGADYKPFKVINDMQANLCADLVEVRVQNVIYNFKCAYAEIIDILERQGMFDYQAKGNSSYPAE